MTKYRWLMAMILLLVSIPLYAQMQPRKIKTNDPDELDRADKECYHQVRAKFDRLYYTALDTVRDTANAALDSVLGANLDYVLSIGDVSGSSLRAGTIRSNAGVYINYDGPEGDGSIYFYDAGSATGHHLRWDDNPGRFHFSTNVHAAGDITTQSDLKVASGEIDIRVLLGDGFSGFKFKEATDQIEFWINGNRVHIMDADSTASAP